MTEHQQIYRTADAEPYDLPMPGGWALPREDTMPAKRVDRNQAEIVAALRAAGAVIQHLHEIGRGCPDLLVSYTDRTTGAAMSICMEIKDGAKSPSDRRLTPDEQKWHATWLGPLAIVESVDEALAAIGALP